MQIDIIFIVPGYLYLFAYKKMYSITLHKNGRRPPKNAKTMTD